MQNHDWSRGNQCEQSHQGPDISKVLDLKLVSAQGDSVKSLTPSRGFLIGITVGSPTDNMSDTPPTLKPMLETLFIATLIFLFLNRSKRKRRPRSLDGELKELIATDQENKGIALDIKNYLLWIIECNNNDEEKFNDLQLSKAQEIIERAGPAAFYWMSDIAAQLALLSAAQINGIPTNVNVELGESATAGDVVRVVVKG